MTTSIRDRAAGSRAIIESIAVRMFLKIMGFVTILPHMACGKFDPFAAVNGDTRQISRRI